MVVKNFLERGWKFPVEVDEATGKIKMSDDEDDIAEAIKIIIGTFKGERMMRREFGSETNSFVFQGTDTTTLYLLQSKIVKALEMWEPRIKDIEVNVSANTNNSEYGKLIVEIKYDVIQSGNSEKLNYTFDMSEGIK